jgi:hypothetical protein
LIAGARSPIIDDVRHRRFAVARRRWIGYGLQRKGQ